jgi:RHS repeat-associated protein
LYGQYPVAYTYDNANRLTQLTQCLLNTYDDANRRLSTTLPNGVLVTYGYDAASQLTDLTYTKGMTTLGTLTYQYDAAGNRTIVGGTWARTGLPPAQSTWTYNAANQLTAWDQTTVTYDANGDLTQTSGQGTTVTYTWNARQQLVGIAGGGTTASFAYDGLGRRISKTVNSASTQFVYDGLNPVQELSGGSPVANLLPGLGIDEFISRTEGGTTSTFLTNALGSTIALTDGTGTVQTEYTYDPFGMATVTGTSSTNAYQFTGREHDGTGLVYYRARYYSPVIQRFISEDPIGFAGGDANLYAYVFNSPTNFTDPSGLFVYPGWPPPGGNSSKSGDSPPPPDPWDTIGFLPGGGAFGPGGLEQKGRLPQQPRLSKKQDNNWIEMDLQKLDVRFRSMVTGRTVLFQNQLELHPKGTNKANRY